MLQYSKLVSSRDAWRSKATSRAEQVKELKKTQQRHKAKIEAPKMALLQANEETIKKNSPCTWRVDAIIRGFPSPGIARDGACP